MIFGVKDVLKILNALKKIKLFRFRKIRDNSSPKQKESLWLA